VPNRSVFATEPVRCTSVAQRALARLRLPAKQLGHTPETCLCYYARLFDEPPEHPVRAEEAIRAARRHFAQGRLGV
jgi:hypothetical protein